MKEGRTIVWLRLRDYGIDLEPQRPPALPLHDSNAPNPAEEAIVILESLVILESQGSASRP